MSRRRDVVNWAMDNDTSNLPAEEFTTAAPAEVMVACSVRLPLATVERIKQTADHLDTSLSALIRDWVDLGLAEIDHDQSVSLAAVRRALAHVAAQATGPDAA